MEVTDGIALYRMFWTLVGFPVLIICNIAMSYLAWAALKEGSDE